jgi:lipid A 4'-phosphatase
MLSGFFFASMASSYPMQTDSYSAVGAPPSSTETPPLFWVVFAIFTALALIPTIWTDADLAAASLFAGPQPWLNAGQWPWVVWINAQIPTVFRFMVFGAFAGWLFTSATRYGKQWRLQLAFLALAGTLGPGAVVNHVFKDNWQRARPYQVEQFGGTQQFTRAAVITDQCDNNCSFVSGHVACGFFFVGLMLIQPRRRVVWAIAGVGSGLAIGFSRMADVAHWLSDVLWACPITLITSWVVWKLLLLLYTQPRPVDKGTMLRTDPLDRGAS